MIKKTLFSIKCHLNDVIETFQIQTSFTIGDSPTADINVQNIKVGEKYLTFTPFKNFLKLECSATDNLTKLNGQPIQSNKVYLLEINDKITHPVIMLTIVKTDDAQVAEQAKPHEFSIENTLLHINQNITLLSNKKPEEKTEQFSIQELLKNQKTEESAVVLKETSIAKTKESAIVLKKTSIPAVYSPIIVPSEDKGKTPHSDIIFQGFPIRLASLIFESFIVIQIFPLLSLEEYTPSVLLPFLKNIPLPHLDKILQYYCILIILQLISNIFLGNSIVHFCFQFTDQKCSFFKKRIKAVLRVLVGMITTPLLVFDLPVLLKERSLKETLTSSHLFHDKRKNNIFSFVSAASISLVLWLLFLILYDPSFTTKVELDTNTIVHKKISYEEDLSLDDPSHTLELQITASFHPDYILTPILDGILFWNKRSYETISFKILKKISLPKILTSIKKRNPFFQYFYPELHRETFSSNEIYKFLSSLMGYSYLNMHTALFTNGPLLLPYIKLKNKLLSELHLKNPYTITFHKFPQMQLLRLEEHYDESTTRRLYLLHHKSQIMIYEISSKDQKISLVNILENKLFQGKVLSPPYDSKKNLSVLNLIDTFQEIIHGKTIKRDHFKKDFSYLERIIKKNITKMNISTLEHIKEGISNTLLELKEKLTEEQINKNKKFFTYMEKMIKKLFH